MIEHATTILPVDKPQIITTRLLNAPHELVWKVLTTPEHLRHCWGPDGFTNSYKQFDLKVGGEAVFTMHGPDGKDWPNHMTFTKVEPPHLLQWEHGSGPKSNSGAPDPFRFTNEIRLSDENGKTRLTMTLTIASIAERDEKAKYAAVGGRQNLNRLAAYLAPLADPLNLFVIERRFQVSQQRLFEACTRSEEMAQWFAPKGMKTIHAEQDLRPGGSYHYGLASGQGNEMWGLVNYKEVTPCSRLVYTQSFSDRDRNITAHPMAPSWPKEMVTVFDFLAHGPKLTTLKISWTYAGTDDAEAATFKTAHDGMRGGWTGSLDALYAYLSTAA
jgi:uncharacterized protein YndB with AHSA1/START domain